MNIRDICTLYLLKCTTWFLFQMQFGNMGNKKIEFDKKWISTLSIKSFLSVCGFVFLIGFIVLVLPIRGVLLHNTSSCIIKRKLIHKDANTISAVRSKQDQMKVKRRFPNAIIIGAMKSGTGALRKFLTMHPNIVSTKGEETDYFRDFYYKGRGYYLSLMPLSRPDQIVMEKTVYFGHSDICPKRIHEFDPNIKLVLILRNPVIRLISQLMHRRVERGDKRTAEEMCFDEKGNIKANSDWIMRSKYYFHMINWLQYYAKHEILVLDGEEFVNDPVPALTQVEIFLGLEHRLNYTMFKFDKKKGFYCYDYKGNHECLGDNKGRKRIEFKPETLDKLYEYYRPLNEQLFTLLKMPFIKAWNNRKQLDILKTL